MENTTVLSTEDKLRIKLEEAYRNEVRKDIQDGSEKPSGSKLWNLLNSTIGIWFLSTCVVGLITFLYSEQQEKDRKQAEMRQLDIEHARRNASLVTILLPYLASAEEKEWKLAIEVTRYLHASGQLPGELESALEGIATTAVLSDSGKVSTEQQKKANAAARVLDPPKDAAQTNSSAAIGLPPRVYIQISGESQREAARSVQSKLKAESFLAPGIENAGGRARFSDQVEVRYYRDEEKAEALQVISVLRGLDIGLHINSTPKKINPGGQPPRPRHYEIWFPKS